VWFAKGTPWTRRYAKLSAVEPRNAAGGPSSDAKLVKGEEVLMLRQHGGGVAKVSGAVDYDAKRASLWRELAGRYPLEFLSPDVSNVYFSSTGRISIPVDRIKESVSEFRYRWQLTSFQRGLPSNPFRLSQDSIMTTKSQRDNVGSTKEPTRIEMPNHILLGEI